MNFEDFVKNLDAQNFRPHDSKIASAINHPITAIEKLAQFIQGNMGVAGNEMLQRPTEQGAQAGLNLAGLTQTGGMPFMPMSRGGTVGTLALLRPKAQDAALTDFKNGASIADLWQEHQAYPWLNVRGRKTMLGEIPDTNAKLIADPKRYGDLLSPGEVIQHPELEKTGVLKSLHGIETDIRPESQGQYFAQPDYTGYATAYGKDRKDILSILLHELTHHQQHRWGLLPGGSEGQFMHVSPDFFENKLKIVRQNLGLTPAEFSSYVTTPVAMRGVKLVKELGMPYLAASHTSNMMQRLLNGLDYPAFQSYRDVPGELQARVTQRRLGYSPEQLARESPAKTMHIMGYSLPRLLKTRNIKME